MTYNVFGGTLNLTQSIKRVFGSYLPSHPYVPHAETIGDVET